MNARVLGAGVVTPLGRGLGPTMEGLLAGANAVGPIRRFDARRYPTTFAAEAPGAATEAPDLARDWLDAALDEALVGLDLSGVDPSRIGVFMGAEAARPSLARAWSALKGAPLDPDALAAHAPWAPTRHVAARLGATGPSATLSTACTSSGQAVGEALLALRRGEVDVAVAAGVDVLVHPLMVVGFSRLGALSTRNDDPAAASRPFDLDRDGFVLGEGAGVLILGGPGVLPGVGRGTVRGYGCTSNAWRITDSPPDGRGAAGAMAAALQDAGARPADVAWVHAHGTSTRQNDASEAAGIRAALDGARDAAVSSTKGSLGHLVAACGVVGCAVALEAVARRQAPPTRNLDRVDPACALGHVRGGAAPLGDGVAVVNAFGFGGVNASVVVGP